MSYLAHEFYMMGLPGPTHFFGGLSKGNLASENYIGMDSNPKKAAIQALDTMFYLSKLGAKVIVIPPQERPHIPSLKRLGFTGTAETILSEANKNAPWLLERLSSASSMFMANSATVTPSIDAVDQHVHFTPANCGTYLHRSIEKETNSDLFQALFPNSILFSHHQPLPINSYFFDEGSANHLRFCRSYEGPGVHLFVYGNNTIENIEFQPLKNPSRQTLQSSEAIARLHQIYPGQVVFAQQNSRLIDQGVFHNDLISTSNQNLFLYHEAAFNNTLDVLEELKEKIAASCDIELFPIEIKEEQISIEDVINSYLFNSLILTLPDGSMTLIAPQQCSEFPSVENFLKELTSSNLNPIGEVHYVNLDESMHNGGGPACLTLKMILNENEMAELNPKMLLDERLYQRLADSIMSHYRSNLTPEDLADSTLYQEQCAALDELTTIFNLGSLYSFQRLT